MRDYLHEIPKETLTVENVKQDIKNIYKSNIGLFVVLVMFGTLLLLIGSWIWADIKIAAIFFVVAGLAGIIGGIISLFTPLMARKITSKKLVIVEDWLVEIKERVEYAGKYTRPYYEFCFASGARYTLYMGAAYAFENRHYKWSEMYNMSAQGIYNYSKIDDDFYLVFSNEKKRNLLLIYNKKLFDFKDYTAQK